MQCLPCKPFVATTYVNKLINLGIDCASKDTQQEQEKCAMSVLVSVSEGGGPQKYCVKKYSLGVHKC